MEKIEAPFEIQVVIEGNSEKLLVIPEREEPDKYELFDQYTPIGTVWKEEGKQGRVWCGEGLVVRELLIEIGEQIDDYVQSKLV